MSSIPDLDFHLICQFEAEETFTVNAYYISLRYYACLIQFYRHHTNTHKISQKLATGKHPKGLWFLAAMVI